MKSVVSVLAGGFGLMLGAVAAAETLTLTPASPQPSKPKAGLAVKYAWAGDPPAQIQSISAAKSMVASARPGQPLRGLDYRDTDEGEPVMTFNQAMNVAADIKGYIRFDAPGTYTLETWSNDGIEAHIGGQQVGYFSSRQPCEANQRVDVEVPKAGWYDLSIVYFQKYSTACLMMKWGRKGDKLQWVPNGVFGH